MRTLRARWLRDLGVASSLFVLASGCVSGAAVDDEIPLEAGAPGSGVGGTSAGLGGSGGAVAGSSAVGGSVANGGSVAKGGTSGEKSSGGSSGSATGGSSGTGATSGTGGASLGGQGGAGGGGGSSGTAGLSGSGGKSGGQSGAGGSSGTFGAGSGGKGGAGAAGQSGSSGSAGAAGSFSNCPVWPSSTGSQSVSSTIMVSGTYDGSLKRFTGSGALGTSGQAENQGPLFQLSTGATLKNVILGNPAADGVHCDGACTLENVWWEDVGEDAATFRGSSSSQQMTVRCGGAKNAADKVFQHNGAGTLTIQDFTVETFGKLYRSCGNCSTQYGRHVVLDGIVARSGSTLVGLNTNYGDTADFTRITTYGKVSICDRYTGNSSGAEPVKTGSGSDSQYCRYSASDITSN